MEIKTSPETIDHLHAGYKSLRSEIAKVIVGQDDVIHRIIVSILCRGHVLLIGVPGLAKTLLIHTISEAVELDFNRIQFTPDLMPSDITGTEIIEQDRTTGGREFKFVKGPVFANVVLADEINRTPPKTQAALLEAMQEHHVTAAGQTYALPEPFFVLATQNPIEQEGTYPLPEAQLDRFMLNLWLDYPTFDQEVEVVRQTTSAHRSDVKCVMTARDILTYQQFIREIPVADNVIEYAVRLVGRTRPGTDAAPDFVNQYLSYGAGPRASQYLIMGAKTMAALDGRLTPSISDVNALAISVLRHRIVSNFTAEAESVTSVDIIERLMEHSV
ncbi:MAG: AAA family ATPase [Bacteroidetes bacterium CG12_big_fil_rev_8_21_14_0_65_60_17]|nr:MAG: AAA family ATPase [Bacteroidetes bacterium CG12_big_fil_rev_8_21_14_0_65_60_17]